jgi:alpha-tubulin suppressor-like RCC1 family protein
LGYLFLLEAWDMRALESERLDGLVRWSLRSGLAVSATVALLAVGGCAAEVDGAEVEVSENALCSGVQLGLPNTSTLDGIVTLTATGTTCVPDATAEYRFLYRLEGTGSNVYTELQAWSTSTTADWDTDLMPSGVYSLRVYARAEGTNVVFESQSTKSNVLVGDVCPSVALGVSPTGIQAVGTSLTFTALATCTGGTAQYKFARRPAGTLTYTDFQDWSTDPVATWDTTGTAAGQYNVIVYARSGTNLLTESQKTITPQLGETCATPTFTVNPSTVAGVGQLVDLSASTTCTGGASPEYQFQYRLAGSPTWTVVQAWSALDTGIWDTNALGLPKGAYQLRADVRANDYAGPLQALRTASITLGDYCGAVALTTSLPSQQPLGTLVDLTATATCASGTPEYRFSVRFPGATTDTLIEDWGDDTSSFQALLTDPSGLYTLRVEARAVDSAGAVQSSASRGFNFGDVCTQMTFVTLAPSPQPIGTDVPLQAAATCTGAAIAEYQLSYRPGTSGTWIVFYDWNTVGTTVWPTASQLTGSYQLRAQTRATGNLSSAEATRQLSFDLNCPTGYTDDGAGGCTENDECTAATDDCDPIAQCTNTPGSFSCICPPGTIDVNNDGTECTLIDKVAAGWNHSCATTISGRLYCWGDNVSGELGDGTNTDSSVPVQVGTDADWVSVSAGYYASCGIRAGSLYCWGYNGQGQLGDGSTTNSNAPVQVGTDTDWESVESGYYHACGLRRLTPTDAGVYCWGYNSNGQLGDGTNTNSSSPVQVGTDTDWTEIDAGGYHNCGLRGGTLNCWGWNGEGELGLGDTVSSNVPMQIGIGTDWIGITAGASHTCGLRSPGTLHCWGYNRSYQLGIGTNVTGLAPFQVGTADDWSSVAAGGTHSCAIRASTLYCWGVNSQGQVGDGTTSVRKSPTQVGTETDWTNVATGGYHSCGGRSNGVYCWGQNTKGQVGNGTLTNVSAPSGPLTF